MRAAMRNRGNEPNVHLGLFSTTRLRHTGRKKRSQPRVDRGVATARKRFNPRCPSRRDQRGDIYAVPLDYAIREATLVHLAGHRTLVGIASADRAVVGLANGIRPNGSTKLLDLLRCRRHILRRSCGAVRSDCMVCLSLSHSVV